jgi:hypothetical protein
MQRWALRLLVLEEKDWVRLKDVWLEEPVKPKRADNDLDEWDWITPQFMAKDWATGGALDLDEAGRRRAATLAAHVRNLADAEKP